MFEQIALHAITQVLKKIDQMPEPDGAETAGQPHHNGQHDHDRVFVGFKNSENRKHLKGLQSQYGVPPGELRIAANANFKE